VRNVQRRLQRSCRLHQHRWQFLLHVSRRIRWRRICMYRLITRERFRDRLVRWWIFWFHILSRIDVRKLTATINAIDAVNFLKIKSNSLTLSPHKAKKSASLSLFYSRKADIPAMLNMSNTRKAVITALPSRTHSRKVFISAQLNRHVLLTYCIYCILLKVKVNVVVVDFVPKWRSVNERKCCLNVESRCWGETGTWKTIS